MYTEEQIEKITEDFQTRIFNNLTGVECAKIVFKMQEVLIQDTKFKETCTKDLISALEGGNSLKYTLRGMFPISELFTKEEVDMNKYTERFIDLVYNKNYNRAIHTFMAVYTRYGCMGLNTNLNILERELKNPTLVIKYKEQIEEIVDYEKFVTGIGGDLMAGGYISTGLF